MKIGQVVAGKYKLIRLMGEGGMGVVYEALHEVIGRRVAFKHLHKNLVTDPEVVTRFLREAQTATSIGSEHIVDVTDGGTSEDGAPFIVMEYLEGQDLAETINGEGPLSPTRAAALMTQLCQGLEAAHRQGIVHRDLKPANLFLTRREDGSELVKVLDFGIAKLNSSQQQASPLTRTGTTLGTPFYMAPEQFYGSRHVDHRADLYSAGVILYQLLTGNLPFEGETYESLIIKVATEEPPRPSELQPGLEPALEQVVLKAMARKVEERFQSMSELAEALAPFCETSVARAAPALPPTLVQSGQPSDSQTTRSVEDLPALPATLQPSPIRSGEGSKALKWGLMALVALAVGAGGTFVVLSLNDGGREDQRAPSDHSDVAQIEAQVRDLIEQELFHEARTLAESLPHEFDTEARELVHLVEREQRAQQQWHHACLETPQNDHQAVHHRCHEIAQESRYRHRGCCADAAERFGRRRLENLRELSRRREHERVRIEARELADDQSLPSHIREEARQLGDETQRARHHSDDPGRGDHVRRTLTSDVIQRHIQEHRPEVQACYEDQLRQDRELSGRVVARLVIAPSGEVINTSVRSSTLGNPAVERCIEERLRHIRFPEFDRDRPQTVSVPFVFSPRR